ncbi:MAG: hypothetical protein RL367_1392, partial [Pseudomonadota bacterium]
MFRGYLLRWLTQTDWSDLRHAAILFLILILVMVGLTVFKARRAKRPFDLASLGTELRENLWMFIMIFLIGGSPFSEIAKRHDLPAVGVNILTGGIVAILLAFHYRGMAGKFAGRAADYGITNPKAAPVPKIPPSREETQLQRKLWMALAGLAALAVALFLALPWAMAPLVEQPETVT